MAILAMLQQGASGGMNQMMPPDMPVPATNLPMNDPTAGVPDMQRLAMMRAQGLI